MVFDLAGLLDRYKEVVSKTRRYFKKAGKEIAVLGISGGIDSAITARLLADALGSKNVFGVIVRQDDNFADVEDAVLLCKDLGITYQVVDLRGLLKMSEGIVKPKSAISRGNLAARLRMAVLYGYANNLNALVVGTSNKTELSLGYFTKYGDGAADIMPIGNFYKTEVFKIAEHLSIPRRILKKKPGAGFWKGQTDEGELGASYGQIDKLLIQLESKNRKAIEGRKKLPTYARKILILIEKNKHKKKMPVVIR